MSPFLVMAMLAVLFIALGVPLGITGLHMMRGRRARKVRVLGGAMVSWRHAPRSMGC